MTEQAPAYEMNGCITAQDARSVLNTLVCEEGVGASTGELLVTAGTGMSVDVAAGEAFIEGDFAAWDGMYHTLNDGTVTKAIAAADPANARIDIVVVQIRDSQYSGVDDDGPIQVVTGVPSAVPVAPATPPSALLLAEIQVPAGATSSASYIIVDRRVVYKLCSGAQQGAIVESRQYTIPGSYTYTVPADAKRLWVRVVGASGAGGGADVTSAGQGSVGAGGAGGGYSEKMWSVGTAPGDIVPGASPSLTVGAGGVGVLGDTGGAGGSSSFNGSQSATGGNGGMLVVGVNGGTIGGGPGVGSGGDFNAPGGGGHAGFVSAGTILAPGHGGQSGMGQGGARNQISTVGFNGQNSTNGGGSGSANAASTATTRAGGNGGDGYVLIVAFR